MHSSSRARWFSSAAMTGNISIPALRDAAKNRPAGYLDEILAAGHVDNDVLHIDRNIYAALRQKYSAKPPSLIAQAASLMSAAGQAVKNPAPASKEEQDRRLSICHACEFLKDGKRCLKCGCYVNWKSRLEAWHCPINKW